MLKRHSRYLAIFGLLVAGLLLAGACTGPIGPAGAAGAPGKAGPAGPEGPPGRSPAETGTSLSATIAGGKLIIMGSGFPAGKGVWLNVPGAGEQGRDFFLTKDLAIVNASGAFRVELDMAKSPFTGKGALKAGVWSIKSVGGDVVATTAILIPAPPKVPAKAPTPPPAKAPTPTPPPAKAP